MTDKKLTKAEFKKLKKKLINEKKSVWIKSTEQEKKEIFELARHYISFLSSAKTEREAVEFIFKEASSRRFQKYPQENSNRLIWTFRGKNVALSVKGKKSIMEGLHIIASHIDSPRLDLKPNPLYEDIDLAFLKTHYYGGIKKFHWLCRPLAVHGTFMKDDGRSIYIILGEKEEDPVFTINDLLPHLSGKVQAGKKIREAIPGEKLNLLVGGLPIEGPEDMKEGVKLALLKLLNEKYDIVEQDFTCAEIEVVPAGKARDVGLDKAFVGGYGQDDRVCAFASMKALFDVVEPEYTSLILFTDKEETGSDGSTGAKSRFLEKVIYDLIRNEGNEPQADSLDTIFLNTRAISADVTAAIEPDYQEVHEKLNNAKAGYGISLTKYTGSGGKYSANDANAEYLNWIRQIWNRDEVIWQTGSLGKIDEGGGGTIAKFLASRGMEIVDAGVPVLSMHSPFEVVHKADLYMTYRGYLAFLNG